MISLFFKNCKIVTQSIYSNKVESVNLESVKCSKCNHTDCLRPHAYYSRSYRIGSVLIVLRIKRVICAHCGITHALLPVTIIPYTQRTLDDTIFIYDLLARNVSLGYDLILDHPSISLSDFYILRRTFHLWKNVMASISINDQPWKVFKASFEMTHRNLSQIRFRHYDFYLSY